MGRGKVRGGAVGGGGGGELKGRERLLVGKG